MKGVEKDLAERGCDVRAMKKLASYTTATLTTMKNSKKRKLEEVGEAPIKAAFRRQKENQTLFKKLGHDVVITKMKDKKFGTHIAFCRNCYLSKRHITKDKVKCQKIKGLNNRAHKYWTRLVATDHLKLEECGVRLAKLRRWLAAPVSK